MKNENNIKQNQKFSQYKNLKKKQIKVISIAIRANDNQVQILFNQQIQLKKKREINDKINLIANFDLRLDT